MLYVTAGLPPVADKHKLLAFTGIWVVFFTSLFNFCHSFFQNVNAKMKFYLTLASCETKVIMLFLLGEGSPPS